MPKGRNGGELAPAWQKGQTGNPKGSSRKARERALLRDALGEGLAAEITETMAKALAPRLAKLYGRSVTVKQLREQIEGLKVAQAIAANVLLRALAGDVKAIDQILSAEPKALQIETEAAEPRSPLFVPSEEDEAALVEDASDGGALH